MSSWKKIAKTRQRKYQERHQPQTREHLGLLEKKKDYKIRADVSNRKAKVIKKLNKAVLDKNPDEFYFHMINSKVIDGIHHELEKDDDHTPEQVKLMETQDLRYVTMKRAIEIKKINKLKAELHLLDAANSTPNTHIFFVDSKKEIKNFDVAKRLGTHPDMVDNRTNRMRLEDLGKVNLDNVDISTLKAAAVKKKKAYAELTKRIEREKELAIIQRKMELKRHLSAPGASRPMKLSAATKSAPAEYIWKYERKR